MSVALTQPPGCGQKVLASMKADEPTTCGVPLVSYTPLSWASTRATVAGSQIRVAANIKRTAAESFLVSTLAPNVCITDDSVLRQNRANSFGIHLILLRTSRRV